MPVSWERPVVHLPELVSLPEAASHREGLLGLQFGPLSVWMMRRLPNGRENLQR